MQRCYEERRRFGRIWYRFPSGEAGSDVYSRVGDLTLTLTLALTLTLTLPCSARTRVTRWSRRALSG